MNTSSEHKSHILPLKVYFGVALALLVMTALTVEVASIDFGEWNVVIALAIAVFKATLVALIFMHLLWDNKLYTVVFVSALVFLGFFLTLTMYDTLERDRIYAERNGPIVPEAIIYNVPDSLKLDSSALVEDTVVEDDEEDTDDAEEEDWGFE